MRVDDVVRPDVVASLAVACEELARNLVDPRSGDKPHGDTKRLTALDERLPVTSDIAHRLGSVVDQILPTGWTVSEIAYRCPGPGTDAQKLHADDVPRLDPTSPVTGATAIVPLVDFTIANGATRVVPGSHRRVDRQRLSQTIDHLPEEEYLIGAAGSAFVYNRHLLHAGSLNRSEEPRPALQISYLRGVDVSSLEEQQPASGGEHRDEQ